MFAELLFAHGLIDQLQWSVENEAGPPPELSEKAVRNRLQGLRNNLRGLAAELEVAKTAPAVVALTQVFPLRPPGIKRGTAKFPLLQDIKINDDLAHPMSGNSRLLQCNCDEECTCFSAALLFASAS